MIEFRMNNWMKVLLLLKVILTSYYHITSNHRKSSIIKKYEYCPHVTGYIRSKTFYLQKCMVLD